MANTNSWLDTVSNDIVTVTGNLSQAGSSVLDVVNKYNQISSQGIYSKNVASALSSTQTSSGQANLLGMALGNNFIWVIVTIAVLGFGFLILHKR